MDATNKLLYKEENFASIGAYYEEWYFLIRLCSFFFVIEKKQKNQVSHILVGQFIFRNAKELVVLDSFSFAHSSKH
jgi:hypothetical protein